MICIVTAADIEFKTAAGLLTESSYSLEDSMPVCRGRFANRRLTILKSEVGAHGFAQRLAAHLRNNKYEALVVAGLAGALDPKLKTGDAVVFDICYNGRANNGTLIACDDKLSQFLSEILVESGQGCHRGAGVTVDRIITRASEKIDLGVRYRAAAVDMETYDSLSVCADFGLSAAALRVVSDDAASDLPDFNRAIKPDGRMDNWRMAAAIMMSPIDSIRFLLSIKRVLSSLRASLQTVFGALEGGRLTVDKEGSSG
jgi:nucleoside phosphorylase